MGVTDDERRRVAERLRMSDERDAAGFDCLLAEVVRGREFCETPCEHCHGQLLDELADLIEPKPVDFAGFNHGIDSIYQWCFERLEGADGPEDELFCSIMRAIEDYRHPELATAHTARPVDRDALLALADEYKHKAEQAKRLHDEACRSKMPSAVIVEARQFAYMMAFYNAHDRIREACGERA